MASWEARAASVSSGLWRRACTDQPAVSRATTCGMSTADPIAACWRTCGLTLARHPPARRASTTACVRSGGPVNGVADQGRQEVGDAGLRHVLTGQRGLVADQGDQALDEAFCRPALQNGVAIAQAWLQEDQGRGADGLQEFVEPWTPQGRRGDAEPHLLPGGGGDLVGAGQDAKARQWHGLPPCRLGAIEGVERQSRATRLGIFFADHEADPGPAELEMPSIGLPNRTRAYQQDAHLLCPSGQKIPPGARAPPLCHTGHHCWRVPASEVPVAWRIYSGYACGSRCVLTAPRDGPARHA